MPTSYKRAAETGLWSVTGGVGLHGLRCGGFDATPGGSRVRGVCAFEYDCNPAAPPSGPGSLAGREAAARTALRKTHIERTTHHTHHAPRTHPPLSKRLLCPAKRVALSLPRRTHARRAKVVALAPLEVWAASPPSERRAAPQGSGARGLGLRGSARSCTQSGNVCVKLQSLSNLHFRPQRRCTRADCMRVSRQRAPCASGGSLAARFPSPIPTRRQLDPSPPAMGGGARRVGWARWWVDAGLSCWTLARGDGHSLRAVHELHKLPVRLGFRHHPWRSSTGLLGAGERPARPSPLAEHVPHRGGAAASPTLRSDDATSARGGARGRGGALLANFRGEITNQQLHRSQSTAVAGAATRQWVRVAYPELPPHLGGRISTLPCAPPSSPPPAQPAGPPAVPPAAAVKAPGWS